TWSTASTIPNWVSESPRESRKTAQIGPEKMMPLKSWYRRKTASVRAFMGSSESDDDGQSAREGAVFGRTSPVTGAASALNASDAVAQEPDGLGRRLDVSRALLHGGGHGSRATAGGRLRAPPGRSGRQRRRRRRPSPPARRRPPWAPRRARRR